MSMRTLQKSAFDKFEYEKGCRVSLSNIQQLPKVWEFEERNRRKTSRSSIGKPVSTKKTTLQNHPKSQLFAPVVLLHSSPGYPPLATVRRWSPPFVGGSQHPKSSELSGPIEVLPSALCLWSWGTETIKNLVLVSKNQVWGEWKPLFFPGFWCHWILIWMR